MTEELEPPPPDRLREIFYLVEPLPPEQRVARIEKECNGDVALARELIEMLDLSPEADKFIEDLFSLDVIEDNPKQLIGQTIDCYRLEELVGTGGMGFVFRAVHQSPDVDQVVAIKILRSALLNHSMQRRFAREARILARLDHPNIARFMNIGLHEARPYFIMEFVDGIRIDQYCSDNCLDIPARLELFRTVLSAVAFTQRHLIIHRDLKPQNIFVTKDGSVKVLDFGIGKFLAEESPGADSLTRAAGPMLTPQAAAPEQWEGDNTTTATDVYALAVLLFNLLCGAPPYQRDELKKMGGSGLWPDNPPDMLPVLYAQGDIELEASRRGVSSQALRQTLRGDLQTIVSKAMATSPDARYDSASQFKQDIDNYLSNRPLIARPASALYTARKFLLRNARAAGFLAAVVMLISALVLQVYFESVREKERAVEIARERDKALASSRLLKDVFSSADPAHETAVEITVREALVNNAPQLLSEQHGSPKVQIALAATVGQILTEVGAFNDAEPFLEQVVRLVDELRLIERAFESEERDAIDARLLLIDVYAATGRYEEALETAGLVAPLIDQQYGDASEQELVLLNSLSSIYTNMRDKKMRMQAVSAALQFAEDHPQLSGVERANAINNHALANRQTDPLPITMQRLSRARAVAATAIPETHPLYARLTSNLAAGYLTMGDTDTARKYYEEVVATINKQGVAPNQSMALAAYGLGALHMREGDFQTAQPLFSDALTIQRRFRGDDDHRTLILRFGYASCLEMNQQLDEAEVEYVAIASALAEHYPTDRQIPKFYARLAALQLDTGDAAAAAISAATARRFATANATRDTLTQLLLDAIAVMINPGSLSQREQRARLQELYERAADNAGAFDIPLIKIRRWLEAT